MPAPLIVITGSSGSGKATFLRALEDRGYFCVDNLPIGLMWKFAELLLKSEGDVRRAALVVDVREGQTLDTFPDAYRGLLETHKLDAALYFMEASDEALIRRFSETRRPHPIDATLPIRDAIGLERERLGPIREMADHIVDTSHLSVHDLRSFVHGLFDEQESSRLLVTFVSFGYKHGIPIDADMIFDARFLPNPYFVTDLRDLSGKDQPVADFMRSWDTTLRFMDHLGSMLDFLLPQFEKEGKSYLTVGIGCTGGRHRSVMIVETLAGNLADSRYRIQMQHRDVDKV